MLCFLIITLYLLAETKIFTERRNRPRKKKTNDATTPEIIIVNNLMMFILDTHTHTVHTHLKTNSDSTSYNSITLSLYAS